MTHHSEAHERDPAGTDDALQEAQTGKGYGEDEYEREAAIDEAGGESGQPPDAG